MNPDFNDKRREQASQYIVRCAQELGIEWDCAMVIMTADVFRADACMLATDHERRFHLVPFMAHDSEGPLEKETCLHLLLKALCYARIAEAGGKMFSLCCIGRPDSSVAETTTLQKSELTLVSALVQSIVEIWSNDLRDQHWPDITSASHLMVEQSLLQRLESGFSLNVVKLFEPANIIRFASFLGETRRHGTFDLLNELTRQVYETHASVHPLISFYENLEQFPIDGNTCGVAQADLELLLQQCLAQGVKLFGRPYTPTIKHFGGNSWWELRGLPMTDRN